MKNFFLTYLYPASFFFLSFCSKTNKEHHIVYEQMPLEAKADSKDETKNWISTFKKGYYPRHFEQLTDFILEDAWNKIQSKSLEGPLEKENLEFVFGSNPPKTPLIQKTILDRIRTDDLFKFKSNVELFIKNDLEMAAESLMYDELTTNPLKAISKKTVSHSSYTQLLQILFAKTQGQHSLRKKELYLIFTPGRVNLGFIKKDDVQGKLLFGVSSTNTGAKAIKYYGPTKNLSGSIAVVDFELSLILSALSDKITNLTTARDYALDQSAKKAGISLTKLSLDFKNPNPLAFELNGSPFESPAPAQGQKLTDADFTYVEGASSLDLNGLKNSYKSYVDLERRKELNRKYGSGTIQSLGTFNGWNKAEAFVADYFSNKKDYAPTSSLLRMLVKRKCHADVSNSDNKDFLRSWFILGNIRSYWKFNTIEEDNLAYCQNQKDLGEYDDEENSVILNAHSRLLQPLYVALPKNPKSPETPPAEEDVFEISQQQERLVKELAVDFCAQLNMKSVYEYEKINNGDANILGFWKELFHTDEQIPAQSFSKAAKNNNFYEIYCLSLSSKSEVRPPKDTKKTEEKTPDPNLNQKTSSTTTSSRSL